MDNDPNKKMCAGCGKKDCEQCIEDGNQSFCCQKCCDEHKKPAHPSGIGGKNGAPGKKKPVNVCNFC